LLLRIAGRFSVPLPIFMLTDRDDTPDIVLEANMRVSFGAPSIVKELPGQMLGDLQEWLQSNVLSVQLNRSSGGV
jgi:hypothetical protein